MFIYTVNDTESDKRIKNKKLKYKIHQKYKNTFQKRKRKRKTNVSNSYLIIYQFSITYILYILYIVYILYISCSSVTDFG